MPVKDDSGYPGGSLKSEEWQAIRAAILEREGDCCKFCRAPNHQWIVRSSRDRGTYQTVKGKVYDVKGEQLDVFKPAEFDWQNDEELVQIVLTIMHLDHDETSRAEENLAAGCQRCHNVHDAPHRKKNAAETRRTKRAARDLFEAAK